MKRIKRTKVIEKQGSGSIDLNVPIQLFKADERENLQDSVTGMTSTVAADETGLPSQVFATFTATPAPISFEDPLAVQERADAKANTDHGAKMRAGRKVGAVGAVRKAIQRVLKDTPTATTAEVWSAIKARPPKGLEFRETTKLGKYIESMSTKSKAPATTGYRRFENMVSEERVVKSK